LLAPHAAKDSPISIAIVMHPNFLFIFFSLLFDTLLCICQYG